jgi:hypothetical protein
MAHTATKAFGMKHGCEKDEKKPETEEEKKDDEPEVPNMQKFARAGRNLDPNAPPLDEKKPEELIKEEK